IDLTGLSGTITLGSALPHLGNTNSGVSNKEIDIEAPGVAKLIVARSGATGTPAFRIFTVDAGTNVKVVGLTIMGGSSDRGGGLLVDGGAVALTDVTVAGNQAVGAAGTAGANGGNALGGGIYLAGGSLTLNHDIIQGNVARGGTGGNGWAGGSAA